MQTNFFKKENQSFFYKTDKTWAEILPICFGECVGKIVTKLVGKTYSSQLVNEIESDPQHKEFENYWIAVKDAHSMVHDDLTEFQDLIKSSNKDNDQ